MITNLAHASLRIGQCVPTVDLNVMPLASLDGVAADCAAMWLRGADHFAPQLLNVVGHVARPLRFDLALVSSGIAPYDAT